MNLAVIGDIHGNLFALDAIISDIRQRQIEQILCLGDVVAGGPQPREALQRLQALACPTVMGNTDAWLLEPQMLQHTDLARQNTQDIKYWCSQQLSADDKAFISTFQPFIEWPLDATQTLLAYHGSPRSFSESIMPTTPDERLDEIFTEISAHILVGGHIHQQFLRRYRDKVVFNPGSVGMARDRTWPPEDVRNPPWGEYAIVRSEGNQLNIELLRVPFDIEGLLAAHFTSGMPHAEWSANLWNRT